MYKEFYFYERKYLIDEYGQVIKCAYVDTRYYPSRNCSETRLNKAVPMKPYRDRDGYLNINLTCQGKRLYVRLHHLSYMVWKEGQTHFDKTSRLGYNSRKGLFDQIDRINGNKQDNRPENLEKVTLQENIRRSVQNKTHDSQLKAMHVSIYRDGTKLATVFRLKEALEWFAANVSLKANSGTLSAYIHQGRPWHGYILKYESNDYRKS